ncbi:ThiF family adenylyltransferase [bacterium]|nr:ThiF family adenylyltransferase [bacterium]
MQFVSKRTNYYFYKVNQCADENVRTWARELVDELAGHKDMAEQGWEVTVATPEDAATLNKLVTVAYQGRYAAESERQTVSLGEVDMGEDCRTYCLWHTDNSGQRLLMGTVRLAWGDKIELFKFFAPSDGVYKHERENLVPYECQRLALHPFFSLTTDKNIKIWAGRWLWQAALQDVPAERVWLVCTMNKRTARFAAEMGIMARQLPNWQLAQNEITAYQLQHWPHYWREAAPYEIIPADNDWRELLAREWNLDFIREVQRDPATMYPGRPLLLSAEEMMALRVFDLSDANLGVDYHGQTLYFDERKFGSVVASTLHKLQENLSAATGPVADYLHEQFDYYKSLADKRTYGFYAFYFDAAGNLQKIIQFPPLPVYKLALTCSASQLYQPSDYSFDWVHIRALLARAHVLIAGASVASGAAENLIRDGRIGYLTIGDAKPPNPTNFNRTNYDTFDIADDENKSLALARRLHRQDPTQIIYLSDNGMAAANWADLAHNPSRPRVNLVIEAIDDLPGKLFIVRACHQEGLPLIQINDVGSKAQLTFKNADAKARGESLIFGLTDAKLAQLTQINVVKAAPFIVGL